ncbi:VanZ family protein [Klenkia sp. PcliD-1-E]|uniref:VanZ family protein n=1 Tax=Klenkia sp. PcliD-1-E TaxID=2954492 RepID=UPI002096F1BA|nr:VanZ family protein [Klenkia sp. PcliD-1-E]MCO7218438.1 VanZ family protein [Klenkia sp. PcliD-1-E]
MTLWRASALVAVALFAGVLALGFLPWLAGQYRRYGRLRGWPAAVSAAVGLYACGLVALTLFPLPEETPGACSRVATWQLVPLDSVQQAWAAGRGDGLLGLLSTPSVLQVLLNVALFVPLGLLARWRFGVRPVRAVLLGLAVSVGVEVVQGTAVFGAYACPYRVADVDDVLTNTLGAALGAALAGPAARLLPHPSPAPAADLDPPGLPRRAWAVALDGLLLVVLTGVVVLAVLLGTAATGGGVSALDDVDVDRLVVLVGGAVTTLLVGVVPLVHPARATPGQAAVGLGTARPDGWAPAPRVRVLLRSAVLWGPVVGLAGGAVPAGPGWTTAVLAVGWPAVLGAASLVTPSRRSPAGWLSGTVVSTRARLAGGPPGDAPTVAVQAHDVVDGGCADPQR